MRIELGNGKSVEISYDQYMDILENDYLWERFMMNARGEMVNDPFHTSHLKDGYKVETEDLEEDNEIFEEDYKEFFDFDE